jgi:hypothetical protein
MLKGGWTPPRQLKVSVVVPRFSSVRGSAAIVIRPPLTWIIRCTILKVERFVNEAVLGPMKTFTLRGIKDSPPYSRDGRCLTLEDTVEFSNLVLGLQLSAYEKRDLAAFLKGLCEWRAVPSSP